MYVDAFGSWISNIGTKDEYLAGFGITSNICQCSGPMEFTQCVLGRIQFEHKTTSYLPGTTNPHCQRQMRSLEQQAQYDADDQK